MKTLAMLVAIAAVSAVQSDTAPIAGSWIAQFDSRTFVRLELKTANGTITGGISLGNFEVDSQGAVRRADECPRALTAIFDVKLRASLMTFSRKDGASTDRFEVRLLDGGDAELRFLLDDEDLEEFAADGIPTPKPIHLTKK
jgi:hypothetical protein